LIARAEDTWVWVILIVVVLGIVSELFDNRPLGPTRRTLFGWRRDRIGSRR